MNILIKKQKNRTSHDASLRQSSKTSVVTSEAAPSENSNDPGMQNQKKDSFSLVGTNSSADSSISENGKDVKRKKILQIMKTRPISEISGRPGV